jgi:hypothetical protein
MARHHTVWDATAQRQVDIPFTAEEELARDQEEVESARRQAIADVARDRREALRAKARTGEATDAEIRELLILLL